MKKVLIIVNVSKDDSVFLSKQISDFLDSKGLKSDIVNFDGKSCEIDFSVYKFIITLGGDGTVLFAARGAVKYDIPIFPINLGQFGFIASVAPEEWKNDLQSFLDGKAFFEERTMHFVQVLRGKKNVFESTALNDCVISASKLTSTILLDVKYDDFPLCRLKADGVIIATPTGSTAYSAAAGGPILDSHLEAFVLTPVNSFSLSSRPIVLSTDGLLSVKIDDGRTKDISLSIDGQQPFSLEVFDEVLLKKYPKKVKLICACRKKFYAALKSKLNWLGGPYA